MTSPGKPGPSALGAHSPTTASTMAIDSRNTWVEEDQELRTRVASTSTSSQAPDNISSGAAGEGDEQGLGGAESGSELSELTEDEGPHPLNAPNTEPTRRRKRGLIPPKPWDWAMRGVNGNGDDEDGGNSDGEGGYSHRERQPRSYAEDNDDDEEDDDDENAYASVRRGRGRPRTRGDDDVSDGSENSQDEEDEDAERSYTSEEDAEGEPEGDFANGTGLSLFPPALPPRSLLQPAYELPPEDEDDDMDQDSESDADADGDTPALAGSKPASPVVPRSKPTSTRGPAGMGAMSALATAATLMDVNSALSAPLLVPSGPTVPQSSSITAGSNVVGLSSPTPSSPASSATPSPTGSRTGSPVVKKPISASARRASDAAAKLIASGEVVVGDSVTLPNGDAHKDDGVDQEDPDAEGSVDLDVDVDLDTDIQPHHRAEALDALAMIELKVFIVRDRLLSEKLRELDWEQALVDDGLQHLMYR